jgi:glucokinase
VAGEKPKATPGRAGRRAGGTGHGAGGPPHRPAVIAVDVGGTAIKAMAVRGDHEVVMRQRIATAAHEGGEAVIAQITALCADLAAEVTTVTGRPATALGLAVPGIVDERAGVARMAANIGWRDAPLAKLLHERLGLPVAVCHDVRAAAIAEQRIGEGRRARDFLVLQIGTGIAGALVLRGRSYAGAHRLGGELGHVCVDPAGQACGCGGRGCLETIASAAAVARRYRERCGQAGCAEEVVSRATAGDPLAAQVWREAISALATVLAWYQGVLDPELVIVGGGLAGAGAALLDPLRAALSARLTFQRMPALATSPLGDEAACYGAALAARRLTASPADARLRAGQP